MAPVRKRPSLRARAAKSPLSRSVATANTASGNDTASAVSKSLPVHSQKHRHEAFAEDAWRLTKENKRAIKHNVLMGKVRDAGVSKTRKRRPGKKLKATESLDKLRDSLPDVEPLSTGEQGVDDDDGWEGLSGSDVEYAGMQADAMMKRRRRRAAEGNGKMVMKSLKHRPGAMERKRKLEEREVERFGKNLAQLVGTGGRAKGVADGDGGEDASNEASIQQADKWAALRGFIGGTMEKDRAFATG